MQRGGRRTATCGGVALLVSLLLASALASCGLEPGPALPPNDIGETARDRMEQGGTLRWAIEKIPGTFNAFQQDADEATTRVTEAVLPSLFTLDSRGRPHRNPDYLLSAEVTGREPRQVVVYRINPKAVWTDGRPITPADFIAQWKALSGADPSYRPARNDGYRQIQKVERGSTRGEVKVTFSRPFADWRMLFTPLYPRSATETAEAFNEDTRSRLPATAGPFHMAAVDRRGGDRFVLLIRNSRWWGKRAVLDRIVLTQVPHGQRVAALRVNAVDVAAIEPAASAVRTAASVPGFTVRKGFDAAFTQLTLNGGRGPLADERVRHAVARAVDRKQLADLALGPLGLPVRTLDNHLVMAQQEGYRDNSAALGAPDAQAARALLAEAGWRPGRPRPSAPVAAPPRDGPSSVRVVQPATVRVKAGRPLSLRLVVPTESRLLGAVADRIASMLSRIGVLTEITPVRDGTFLAEHMASGDFDLALFSWPGTAWSATDNRPLYAKPLPARDGSPISEQNYARVGTEEIDHLFFQAGTELDPAASRDLVNRADARIWAEAHSLPLFQRPQVVAVRRDVANAGAFGFRTPRYQDIGYIAQNRG